jgi:3'-phosphoadenosine 5'-phosphosulfate sulfotransferase (PAPS reductase)/FAD synthetase
MQLSDILKRPLVIRTNYGDESIALVQWVFESGLYATVVYIDTGFAAVSWKQRIELGEAHANRCGFKVQSIVSKISFSDAVIGRGSYPSPKFQWCTGLLKGLPFLDWLETVDLKGECVVLIAKRRAATRLHQDLPEWIERCEFHGDRTVWHPMVNVTEVERDALLNRAGFLPLGHRSLECEPCVNSTVLDMKRMDSQDRVKLRRLEKELKIKWQNESASFENYLDLFYRGCGNHFGCGL